MATGPLSEGQRIFLTFLFGFTGSMLANVILKQTPAPVAEEEPPLEDE